MSICNSATFPRWPPSEVVRAVRAGIDPVWPQHDRSPPATPVGEPASGRARPTPSSSPIGAPIGEAQMPGRPVQVAALAANQVDAASGRCRLIDVMDVAVQRSAGVGRFVRASVPPKAHRTVPLGARHARPAAGSPPLYASTMPSARCLYLAGVASQPCRPRSRCPRTETGQSRRCLTTA